MKSVDFEDGIFSFKEKEMDWTVYIHCLEAEHSTKKHPKNFLGCFFYLFLLQTDCKP